ncbi:MAG: AAA family ATPase [Vulcanimicrobiota bacterium]
MSLFGPKIENTQQLAADTLKRMAKGRWGGIPTDDAKVELGDRFVAELSGVKPSAQEKVLAGVAQQAAGEVGQLSSKAAIYRIAIEAMTQQLVGSTGGVLAGVATKILQSANDLTNANERIKVGERFLGAIAQSSENADEKGLSSFASGAGQTLSAAAHGALAQASLQALSQGVGSLTGAVLAKVGSSALGMTSGSDQAQLGNSVLAAISASASANPAEKSLLGTLSAAGKDLSPLCQGVLAQAGLQTVAQGLVELDGRKLASVGEKALSLAANASSKERAALATAVLQQFSKAEAASEGEKQLAVALLGMSPGLADESRMALAQVGLSFISGGMSSVSSVGYAGLGEKALAAIPTSPLRDRLLLAQTVLTALADSADSSAETKSFTKTMAGLAKDLPEGAQLALAEASLASLHKNEIPTARSAWCIFAQKVLPLAKNAPDRAALGLRLLENLAGMESISTSEKLFAQVACLAGAQRSPGSQMALTDNALEVLKAGVSGPVAQALAGLVLTTRLEAADQAPVSAAVLASIGQHGSSASEQALSRLSADAAQKLPGAAANAIALSALNVISKGVNKSLEAVIGDMGKEAMAQVVKAKPEERAAVGNFFLNAIGHQSSNPKEQALCRVATEVCAVQKSVPAQVKVVEATLNTLAEGASQEPGAALASLANNLIAGLAADKASETDQRSLATTFLSGIARESSSAQEKALTKLVAPLASYVQDVPTGLNLAKSALSALQSGQHDAAKLGSDMLAAVPADRLSDRLNIARTFVQHLCDEESIDPAVRAEARQQLEDSSLFRTDEAVATVLGSFLSKAAGREADPKALEAATKGELESLRKSVLDDISASWQERLDQQLVQSMDRGSLPKPEELGSATLNSSWAEIEARFNGEIEQHPLLRQASAEERQAVLGQESWKEWAAKSSTGLSFGEIFPAHELAPIVYTGKDEAEIKLRQTSIEKLAKIKEPADDRDLNLLKATLNALPTPMLQELEKNKYSFEVTRDRVSNLNTKLEGKLGKTGELTDMGEGAHIVEQGQSPRILLRSHWKGGRLHIAPDTLMREIGEAYEYINSRSKPSNQFAEAFKNEGPTLPGRFQVDQPTFACEMFARYQLDPDRLARQLPMAFAACEKGSFTKHKVDTKALAALQAPTAPIVNINPDPFEELRIAEELNRVQKSQGQPYLPYVFEIKGEAQHNVNQLVARLGESLRDFRNPGVPRWNDAEAIVRVPAATFNAPDALEKVLNEMIQSGRGSFLVLDELGQIAPNSAGFDTLGKFIERFGGQIPLLLQGVGSDLDKFKNVLPTVTHKRFNTAPMTAGMITDLLAQTAQAEGYDLSNEALAAIGAKAKDGEVGQAFTLWRGVKSAQTERNTKLMPYLEKDASAVSRVITTDVINAKIVKEKDPLEELERMTGLGAAKRELRSVLAQVRLQKAQAEYGLTGDPPRLNLLFEGNPGTGKTTVAKLFSDALTRVGYLKNNKFKEVRVQDLLAGNFPEENVKKLFESNKGGVIFIDEMHQLKDTAEGRLAFRAMIPYLGHPEYADTVFIGAGYKGEMRDLIRDVDDGAERRFTSVPFDDYSRDELGKILDKMVVDKQRVLDEPSREAALMRLERERRKMKNFGNAGSVQSMLDIAIKKQTTRLTAQETPMTKAQLQALAPEDFAMEKTLTPEEVWKEIDALEGLESIKASLHTICDSIEYDREMGNDPLASFEPYFILDGPPGTGKTTMARLIVKLMAAYDIIPSPNLSESQGADLQAGFVGQTTTKVQKLFESMWGQGGFIDEIGGLARAPEAFKADAAKTMLKQMEDHRGRFILVVADYADRINDFLNIDPGISRRFGHRFSLEPLTEEAAVRSLCKQLVAKDMTLTDEVKAIIATRMAELHAAPDWASSGDVRKVLNTVITQQKTCFLEERAAGRTVDPKQLLPQAVNNGFDTIMREKKAREVPIEERKKDEGLQAETAAATQKPTETKEAEEVKISTEEQAVLDAQAEVDKEFASQLASDPALQAQMEADPNSAYIKRLAEKLNCTPEEAIKSLQKVKIKVKKMVTNVKLVKRFEYHCPYCGGINSPSCAYIGQSLEWKIQHSLKKPWTEEVKENKEVEVEVERDK